MSAERKSRLNKIALCGMKIWARVRIRARLGTGKRNEADYFVVVAVGAILVNLRDSN
jgi:hypothetical protein